MRPPSPSERGPRTAARIVSATGLLVAAAVVLFRGATPPPDRTRSAPPAGEAHAPASGPRVESPAPHTPDQGALVRVEAGAAASRRGRVYEFALRVSDAALPDAVDVLLWSRRGQERRARVPASGGRFALRIDDPDARIRVLAPDASSEWKGPIASAAGEPLELLPDSFLDVRVKNLPAGVDAVEVYAECRPWSLDRPDRTRMASADEPARFRLSSLTGLHAPLAPPPMDDSVALAGRRVPLEPPSRVRLEARIGSRAIASTTFELSPSLAPAVIELPDLVDLEVAVARPDGRPYESASLVRCEFARDVFETVRTSGDPVAIRNATPGRDITLIAAPLDHGLRPGRKVFRVPPASGEPARITIFLDPRTSPPPEIRSGPPLLSAVLRDAGGTPLAGADVSVALLVPPRLDPDARLDAPRFQDLREDYVERSAAAGRSGPDGRLLLPLELPLARAIDGLVLATVLRGDSVAGRAIAPFSTIVVPGENRVELPPIEPAIELVRGRVLDHDGDPVPGARVHVQGANPPGPLRLAIRTAVAGEGGWFRIAGFESDRPFRIEASHPGYLRRGLRDVPLGTTEVTLRLYPDVAIGLDVRAPRGLPEDQITVRFTSGRSGRITTLRHMKTEGGRYELRGIAPARGDLRVYVRHDPRPPILEREGVDPTDPPALALDLSALEIVRLRVTDEAGVPIEGAAVRFSDPAPIRYQTDETGLLTLIRPREASTLSVGKRGFHSATLDSGDLAPATDVVLRGK